MNILLRSGAFCLASLLLAGCGSMTGTSYETLKLAISGPEPIITTNLINQLDRPGLVARLDGSEALLVRASSYRETSEWHGAEQAFVTRNGRLVQTAGMPEESDFLAPLLSDDPFLGDLREADGVEIIRLVDFPARYLTGIQQVASYRVGQAETIEIMGEEHQLVRIEEKVRMPILSLNATNYYWVDPVTGMVVASKQHLVPELPAVFLTEVAPDGGQP